jgi:hypothetical protein
MTHVKTETPEQRRQFDEDLAFVRRAADQLREFAAQERRREQPDGPLVRAARRVERALGIGRG